MTKEEKVLWATWMASTDIWEYAVDIFLDFNQMDPWELNRVWEEGLHITVCDKECVAYPIKSYRVPKIIVLAPYEGTLIRVSWDDENELDEYIVAELKRIDFVAPWVNGLEVKSILVGKWGQNWKEE